MTKKFSYKVVSIALLVLILLGVFFSCESETVLEALPEGLYFDGFPGPFARFIEVDIYGDAYYFYEDIEDCNFMGFAHHDGKATSYFDFLEIWDHNVVLDYAVNLKKPVEVRHSGAWNNYYFCDSDAFIDWLLVYEECDKYLDRITLEAGCEKGIISLTDDEDPLPYMIKSVRVLRDPYTGEDYANWIKVVDNELHLIKKNTLERGFTFEVVVTITTGMAEERLWLEINVVGCNDQP